MNLTKSVRELATNIDTAPVNFDVDDDRFNSIFHLLDKDNSGTLSKEESYTLVRLFELEKTKSKSLKHYLGLVVGVSALVILLLGACTFGAVFVAVKATKDTQVATSGALMNKEGSRMLSTVAQGTRFQLFNTSEDTPLCIEMETFDVIKSDVLQGSKVVLDVEEEGLDERTVLSLDAATKISSSGSTCFHSSDGKEHCFAKAQPGDCSSFADPEGRRQLNWLKDAVKSVTNTAEKAAAATKAAADKAAADAKAAAEKVARDAAAAAAAAKAAADKAAADAKALADKVVADAAAAAKLVETTANNSINSMKAIALGPVYQAAVKVTNDAMKTAKVADAALAKIEAGAKIAGKALEAGVTEVAAVGVLIAEWVEENICQIGISTALGVFFAALLYRPEPTAVATTTAATAPLTTTAATYLVAKASVGAALIGTMCDLVAEAFVELILVVNDIKNAIGSNKDLLIDAIGMTLSLGFDAAAGAMVIPMACAGVVAGVITTLIAQLVCKKTLPYSNIKVRMLEEDEDGWEGGN